MNKERELSTGKIGTLVGHYAVPCILSLLVGALYNIVDQIFIANASYLGSYGNAANTVVFPLTVIAVMIGDGCCAFVSISLGEKKLENAAESVGNSILLCILSGLLLTAVYLLFSDPILTAFGGRVNEETFAFSKEYFFWITLGIPFYLFGQAMNPIIRADGSPRFALLSIGYLSRARIIKLQLSDLRLKDEIVRRTLSLGLCSFLAQISLVAAMAAINNMIRKYSALDPIFSLEQYAQIPMAVVGIVMKFFQIVISIVIGMAAGCIPIVGFNMGAKLYRRVRELFTRLLTCEAAIGAAALLIVELFPHLLIGIFGAANESASYTDFAVKAFRIYLCMLILACINKAAFIFLQAMGKALESTLLSMIREIVFGVGFALLLPRFFGLDGVLWSMPVSDILTAFVSAFLIIRTYRQLSSLEKA